MAFRDRTSLLDDSFGDPFSSSRLGETSLVPYGRSTDISIRTGGGALDRYGGADDFGAFDSPFGRDRGFSSPTSALRDSDYRSTSRDDVYYSSSTASRSPALYSPAASASSSMQVQLSSTSEEDSSSVRVRRREVSTPPIETSRYASLATSEASGGGYRETYKPGRRSLRRLGGRKPELASREEYSFSASSNEAGGGAAGYGGSTYSSTTTEIDDRYRVRSSGSYSRY